MTSYMGSGVSGRPLAGDPMTEDDARARAEYLRTTSALRAPSSVIGSGGYPPVDRTPRSPEDVKERLEHLHSDPPCCEGNWLYGYCTTACSETSFPNLQGVLRTLSVEVKEAH